jgi:hypothetical protein
LLTACLADILMPDAATERWGQRAGCMQFLENTFQKYHDCQVACECSLNQISDDANSIKAHK